MRSLIAAGAEIEARRRDGATPLRVAAVPGPLNPLRWRGIAETDTFFTVSEVNLLAEFDPNAGGLYYNAKDEAVTVANVQNVSRRTFYQRGSFWEDAALKENQQAIKIKQFSNAHFKLIKADPRVAQYSTLGNVRIVLENNQAIEIGPDGKDEMTDAEISTLLKPVPKGG